MYKQVEPESFDLVQSSGLTTWPDRLDALRVRACCQRKVLGSTTRASPGDERERIRFDWAPLAPLKATSAGLATLKAT